jgi:hypothetical protein
MDNFPPSLDMSNHSTDNLDSLMQVVNNGLGYLNCIDQNVISLMIALSGCKETMASLKQSLAVSSKAYQLEKQRMEIQDQFYVKLNEFNQIILGELSDSKTLQDSLRCEVNQLRSDYDILQSTAKDLREQVENPELVCRPPSRTDRWLTRLQLIKSLWDRIYELESIHHADDYLPPLPHAGGYHHPGIDDSVSELYLSSIENASLASEPVLRQEQHPDHHIESPPSSSTYPLLHKDDE